MMQVVRRGRKPTPSSSRSQREGKPPQSQDSDEQNPHAQIQTYWAKTYRRDQPPEQFHRRIGAAVDRLQADGSDARRAPRAGELTGDVDDHPCHDHQEVQVQHECDDTPDQRHRRRVPPSVTAQPTRCRTRVLASMVPGSVWVAATGCQDWLKKTPSAARALSCAVTVTLCGLSRKTLAVTRSSRPCKPNVSPAAKSTRRLASESSISDRFMITGVPVRKCSPIVRASLYVRGCRVVIRVRSVACTVVPAGRAAAVPMSPASRLACPAGSL